jgi:hypothetical protein
MAAIALLSRSFLILGHKELVMSMIALSLPLVSDQPVIPLYDERQLSADLSRVSRNRFAERLTGGLSRPGKMPCFAWGLSVAHCRMGSVLAHMENTTCSACYARKGNYRRLHVQEKLAQRYRGLLHPLWTPSMIFLVRWYAGRYFRWFDTGDLQGDNHLRNIYTVCRHTPWVRHWLPTRENSVLRTCSEEIPVNLTVRLSAVHIDGPPPDWWDITSTVFTAQPQPGSFRCPSRQQGNRCRNCRACWQPQIQDVAYPLH